MNEQNPPKSTEKKKLTTRQQYNHVTDTITGVNVRWRDNLIQLGVTLIFAVVGWFVFPMMVEVKKGSDVPPGVIGAFLGFIVGGILSGIGIMIYRGLAHRRGHHD